MDVAYSLTIPAHSHDSWSIIEMSHDLVISLRVIEKYLYPNSFGPFYREGQLEPCKFAPWCSSFHMSQDFRERGRWLARNVLPHEALIRAKLGRMCLYDLDIEDVIQETYARFMTHPALDNIRHPRQYALLTARGIIVDHFRHSRVVSIASSGNLEMLEIPAPDINSEQRVEFQQEVQAVMVALDQLPPVCRETLILRRVEGLPQREVAERLKISEKTVEKHMATGVRLLISLFGRGGKPRANTSTKQEMASLDDVADKSRD